MKNIKKIVLFIWKSWMWFCTLFATLYFLGHLSIYIIFALIGDFSWNAPAIDSCLDGGGKWHDDIKYCEPASVEYHRCLYEDKWWNYPTAECHDTPPKQILDILER